MALFDHIEFHARVNPDRLALVAFDTFAEGLSYADLKGMVDAASHMLARRGVTPNQRVGVNFQDRSLQIITALALSRMGAAAIVVSADGSFTPGSVDALIGDKPGAPGPVRSHVLEAGALIRFEPERYSPEPPASTAMPIWHFSGTDRALSVREDTLLARIAQRSRAKGGTCAARWLCAVDPRTELGFSTVMETLSAAGAAVFSNGKFEDDIQPMGLYEADHLFISSDRAAAYLDIFDRTTNLSARVRTAIVSGAAHDAEALSRMKQRVSAHTVVHLDLPETGTLAVSSYWHIGKARTYWRPPGVELRIVGKTGEDSNLSAPGMIAVKSDGALRPSSGDLPADGFKDGWYHSALEGSLARGGALVLA